MTSFQDQADRVLRQLDRETWVVTSQVADPIASKAGRSARGGLLATWVMRASLASERPVLILGLGPSHHTSWLIDRSGVAAAHLLREDQAPVGLAFAESSGRDRDKLAHLSLASEHPPVLAECAGWVSGKVFGRLDTGDRIFYWLEIQSAKLVSDQPVLRESGLIAAADEACRARLKADRSHDASAFLEAHLGWAEQVTLEWRAFQNGNGEN